MVLKLFTFSKKKKIGAPLATVISQSNLCTPPGGAIAFLLHHEMAKSWSTFIRFRFAGF